MSLDMYGLLVATSVYVQVFWYFGLITLQKN